jgi:hypothetical protein
MLTAITFSGAIDNLIGILRPIVVLIIGFALIYFLWGLARFILASGDEKGVEEGRKQMLWGIIALFIMISIQGIVYLVSNSLEITGPQSGGQPSSTYVEP